MKINLINTRILGILFIFIKKIDFFYNNDNNIYI